MDGTAEHNKRLAVTASFERSRLEPELLAKAYGLIVSGSKASDLKDDLRHDAGNLKKEVLR